MRNANSLIQDLNSSCRVHFFDTMNFLMKTYTLELMLVDDEKERVKKMLFSIED